MRTKSILFNTDMVRAIQEDRKTVTRRAVKPQPADTFVPCEILKHWERIWVDGIGEIKLPYCKGEILYVRETWHQTPNGQYWYKADNLCTGCTEDGFCLPKGVLPHKTCKLCEYVGGYDLIKWRPSIHMPREAARLFLRVTDVRVERLMSITPEQLRAEGFHIAVTPAECEDEADRFRASLYCDAVRIKFTSLWNSTIKPADRALYGWGGNPWVWVIEFERCEKPRED